MIQMFSLYYFKIKFLEVNILELLLKESKDIAGYSRNKVNEVIKI